MKWTFFGRVLPERMPVTVHLPAMNTTDLAGRNAQTEIVIHQSQITVILNHDYEEDDPFTTRNRVESSVRSLLDLIGFQRGMSFDVEIISWVNDKNAMGTFSIEIPVLYNLKDHSVLGLESEVVGGFLSSIPAQIAFADFREAMRMPVQTGFFCYRSIEAIMQHFKQGDRNDNGAWKELRATLQIDRSAIDYVKQFSDWARHGRSGTISDDERANIFRLTDAILDRFIEHICCDKVYDEHDLLRTP